MEYGKDASSKKTDDLADRLGALGQRLRRLADEQITAKHPIEQRWIEDLRQYHGQYDANTLAALQASKSSQVYTNLTRQKVNTVEARISDMMLPVDERNFAVRPTPVPDLINQQQPQMAMDPMTGQPMPAQGQDPMAQAREAAKAMEDEIHDQLTESGYPQATRDMIHDACLLGTGILKGPITVNRSRRRWVDIGGARVLEIVNEPRPGVKRVDPWNAFPDMSASKSDEVEFFFERDYPTKKALRELAKLGEADPDSGVLVNQIRAVLMEEPETTSTDTYRAERLSLAGIDSVPDIKRHERWEYHGPISMEDLEACGIEVPQDLDPLLGISGVVQFINNRVIKANLNPLDTQDLPYRIYPYEKDDSSVIGGYGLPYLARNPQRVAAGSWRMMLDNGAMSTGPQTVIDRSVIVPADGDWTLGPRKVWWKLDPNVDVRQAFATFDVPNKQAEYAAIFDMARTLLDEETALPVIAQGDQGNATPTMGGMSMLMNAHNVVLRRLVKQFDDNVTVPMIGGFYDFNMQYSAKEEIKGDYEVDARGSSALLVKEMQQQALLNLAQLTAAHPVFGPLTKARELLRELYQSQHLTPDDYVLSEEEMQQMQPPPEAEAQEQDPRLQIAQMQLEFKAQEMQARMQDADTEREFQAWKLSREHEIAMMKLAGDQETTLEKIKADLSKVAMTERNKRDLHASERAVTEQAGASGGGYF